MIEAAAAFGAGSGVIVTNCIIVSNTANYYAGGSYWGTLHNCTVDGNSSSVYGGAGYGAHFIQCVVTNNSAVTDGGGGHYCNLTNSIIAGNVAGNSGGGANRGTVVACRIIGNRANHGAGADSATLNNCLIVGNIAEVNGGGTYRSTVRNCTIVGNTSNGSGGGSRQDVIVNSIIYGNSAPSGSNYIAQTTIGFSCTVPLPSGTGNISSDPLLNTTNGYRLSPGSPCINKASNGSASGQRDLDGNPRIFNGVVDMGAYEFQIPVPVVLGTNGAVIASGDVTPETADGTDFGSAALLTQKTQTFSVTATNIGILTITGVGISGPHAADFSVLSFPTNLDAGASANLVVQFAPFGLGSRTATLTITNNSPTRSNYTFAVSGLGTNGPATRYVSPTSLTPAAPYISWQTAATNIQDAVDSALPGDRVIVTNGVYATGGRAVSGTLSNRVAISQGITVESVNGPEVTIIQGSGPIGNNAVRCVYVGTNAILSGFTLTNGATLTSGNADKVTRGGGVWCETSGMVTNCTITGNQASSGGGGVFGGTLHRCVISGNASPFGGGTSQGTYNYCTVANNSAHSSSGGLTIYSFGGGSYQGTFHGCTISGNVALVGGGSYLSTHHNSVFTMNSSLERGGASSGGQLFNCTITGNSSSKGGGTYEGSLYNCIVYFNSADSDENYYNSTFTSSCTTPPPGGVDNISSDPLLASAFRLSTNSPCLGAGNIGFVITNKDIDGETRNNPPSMGCDELQPGAVTGPLIVAIQANYTNVAVGFPVNFTALINGRAGRMEWNFADGSFETNRPFTTHTFAASGNYEVRLRAFNESNPGGVEASVVITVTDRMIHYVNLANASPTPPYANWATAATNIQDAITAATQAGALVLVTNGIYETGATVVHGAMSNRVAITKPITVQSVNGPAVTQIRGAGPKGNAAVRCAFVGPDAVLSGFTLTNGATRLAGNIELEQSGGGVRCELFGRVTNCWIVGNVGNAAGGIIGGKASRCVISGNSATQGGGAYISVLNHCTVTGNSASGSGGGASNCTLNDSLISGNSASVGGGSAYGALNNCTVTGNSAGTQSGGSHNETCKNSIIYFNTAPDSPNYYPFGSSFSACCTTPLPSGPGNISSNPLFVSATNFHLSASSPCINTGNNALVLNVTDLDGNARIVNGLVDIGAFEWLPTAPEITIQPVGQTVRGGSNVSFTVTAGGSSLNYQWRFNSNVIPGANSSSLNLTSVGRTNAGLYSVIVTNASGSVTSSNALLHVLIAQKLQSLSQSGDGKWSLKFNDADGGLLTTNELADFEVQSSTNLINWNSFTNSLTLTNGMIYFQESGAVSAPIRFFRVQSR